MFRLFVTPATVVFVLFASCCISNSTRKCLHLLHLDGGMVSADAFAFDKSATKRNNVLGQPDYQIASLDLSHRWVDLVRKNQVQALVDVSVENGGDDKNNESVKGQTDVVSVRYGVRLAKQQ